MNDIASVFSRITTFGIQAGWVVLALVALRLILKKCPRSIICALWALVAVRLIFPFDIQSIFSVIPKTSDITRPVSHYTTEAVRTVFPEIDSVPLMTVGGMQSNSTAATGDTLSAHLFYVEIIAWMIGVGVLLIYALISYLRLYHMTRERAMLEKGVYLCDRIPSPFILGIIRPKIFLPSNISEHDKPYVLAHEKAHIKRRDHLWKPLGFLLLSVYWFNPLLWVAYILLCKDIEIACDERVIKEMGTEIKKPYAIALINSAAPRRLISACPLAFGETSVKSRIKNVLNYKKPAFWIIIVAVVLSIVVAVCFLTNPVSENSGTNIASEASDPSLSAEESPGRLEPYEAVKQFFVLNSDKFPEKTEFRTQSEVKANYYGGTYLDGGTQVILLTDISGIQDYEPVGREIRYEKCDYTYDELTAAISDVNRKLTAQAEKGYSNDIASVVLLDSKNRIRVDILHLSDEKIAWFKENISDRDYYIFSNTDSLPEDDLETLTVSIDLPTITYADDQYIYLDGDCGIVIYDYINRKLISRIPVSRLRKLGYTVPYSRASADGQLITIRNYTGEAGVIFPFMKLDPTTGEIIAFTSTGEIPVTDGGLSDISDETFGFDYQDYDIKYDENGKNISERVYRKGDTEYRLSVPGWKIKSTTVWIKKANAPIGFEYHIFEETSLDGKNILLD